MVSHIKVNTDTMRETVAKYDTAKGALNDSITAMKSAVDSVTWTGTAAQAFKDEFDKLVQNLKQSDTIMQVAENELKTTIETMDTAETEVDNTGKKLDTGNVPLPI